MWDSFRTGQVLHLAWPHFSIKSAQREHELFKWLLFTGIPEVTPPIVLQKMGAVMSPEPTWIGVPAGIVAIWTLTTVWGGSTTS